MNMTVVPSTDLMIRHFVTSAKTYCLPYTVTLLFRLPHFFSQLKVLSNTLLENQKCKMNPEHSCYYGKC